MGRIRSFDLFHGSDRNRCYLAIRVWRAKKGANRPRPSATDECGPQRHQRAKISRDELFTTKGGVVRRRLGRPGAEPKQIARARHELAKGFGIGKVARMTGLGTGTVHKRK